MLLNINVKSEGQQRLRIYLIVFRWLALILGFIVAGTSQQQDSPRLLPEFFSQMPMLLVLVQCIYHLIASIVCFKFDDSKLNTALLVLLDICASGFMAWFYGLPYFFLAVMLPVLETAFYFGTFVSGIILVLTMAFFGPLVLGQVVQHLSGDNEQRTMLRGVWNLVKVFLITGTAIYLNYIWSLKQEEEVIRIEKRFQEEKRMLFNTHQEAKKEYNQLVIDLEKKDETIKNQSEEIEMIRQQLQQANNDIDALLTELDGLKEKIEASEKFALHTHQKILIEQKNLLETREFQMEEILYAKDREMEELKTQMHQEYLEELERYQGIIEELENSLAESEKDKQIKIEQLESKTAHLLKNISDLNKSITYSEKITDNLIEAGARLCQNTDLESVYMAIINEALKILPSQTAILFMTETIEKETVLFAEVAATPYQKYFIDFALKISEGSVGWTVHHNRPIIIDRGSFKMKDGTVLSTLIKTEKSALIVPLESNQTILGAIYLGRPEADAFQDIDIQVMQLFAKLAASAVSASIQHETAAQSSLIDEETGVFNEFFFYERLNEEVLRSIRHKIPFSLVLLEVTNFEKLTKNFDEKIQKRVIKDVTDVLRANVRESDVIARLTPSRFAVMFLHSGKSDSFLIAERIRMSVGLRTISSPPIKNAGIFLAVSLAALPEDADNRDDLYHLASKYLEEAERRKGEQIIFEP